MSRRAFHSVVLWLALAAIVLVPSAAPRIAGQAAQTSSIVAIRNATLITVSRGTINNS